MVPAALKERAQWLVWRFEQKAGQKKPAKMPYYASGARRTGTQGSDEDRAALTTFDFALETKSRKGFDGVGFAFLPGDGLVGIDLDNAIDAESGELSARGKEILQACQSFAELSPSRKGLHIYAFGKVDSFKSNDIGVEVFCGSQFFTVTGEHFAGSPQSVNDLSPPAVAMLQAMVEEAKAKKRSAPSATTRTAAISSVPAPDLDKRSKVESALAMLNAECGYEEWLQIGMAVHAELGDGGMASWDYWSSRASKYPGPKVIEQHWRSFRPGGGITGATLFKLAMDAGWKPPKSAAAPNGNAGKAPKRSASRGEDSTAAGGGGGSGGDHGGGGDHFEGSFDPDGLPIIEVRAGELPQTVDQAEAALMDSEVNIYQRDRMLVRVMRRSVPSVRNYKRGAGTLGIVPVELPHLTESFTRAAHWKRWDARGEKTVRINAPDKVGATYMARAGQWKLPELWSVITAPTLRPDGTILQKPGYDEAMKAWYDPCGIDYPAIPDEPSEAEARAALDLLKKAFSSFPFVDDVDVSVALSFALCALVRRSLTSAPLGAITAPVMASGKTLLADVISILATGSAAPTMTYSDNEEEFKKTLLAVLMEGDPVVLMDNVSHPLQGDTLCSILTSETYSQRMLGRTEMAKVQTTTLILANGNQLVIAGDLRTRALLTRLDAKTEHPEERVFSTELRGWFMERRPRLVAAGLTLMRAFICSGKKNLVKPFGRFEHWSDMVRMPLVWLGEADPCASVKELEKDDPARAELRQVLHSWWKLFKTDQKKSSDICRKLQEAEQFGDDNEKSLEEALRDVARDRDGKWIPKRLSRWLSKHAGRRVDNLMLVRGDEKDHTQLWRIDEVTG